MTIQSSYKLKCIVFLLGIIMASIVNSTPMFTYKTKILTSQTIDTPLYYHGVIEPIKKEVVISPLNGTLVRLNIQYGDSIQRGDTIAQINSPDVEKEYHAQLDAFLKAKESYHHAQKKNAATKSLWQLGIVPKNEYLDTKSEFASMFMAYNESRLAFESFLQKLPSAYRINLDALSLDNIAKVKRSFAMNFSRIPLESPFAGVVMMNDNQSSEQQNFRVGKDIKSGDVLIEVADLTGVSARIYVNEMDVEKIKQHQLVEIFLAAKPDSPIVGEVVHVDLQGLRATKESEPKFEVTIAANDLTHEQRKSILIGMTAKLALHLRHENVFSVPIFSVIARNNKSYVRVIRNKKLLEQPVTVVATTLHVALVSSGLIQNEHIVVESKLR